MVVPKFLQPFSAKVSGWLHPSAAVAASTAAAVAGAGVEASATKTAAPASGSSAGGSVGVFALLGGLALAVWYFFIKRGDSRHKHKY